MTFPHIYYNIPQCPHDIPPSVLIIPPSVLMISPIVLNIPHCTEHPPVYCTDIMRGEDD